MYVYVVMVCYRQGTTHSFLSGLADLYHSYGMHATRKYVCTPRAVLPLSSLPLSLCLQICRAVLTRLHCLLGVLRRQRSQTRVVVASGTSNPSVIPPLTLSLFLGCSLKIWKTMLRFSIVCRVHLCRQWSKLKIQSRNKNTCMRLFHLLYFIFLILFFFKFFLVMLIVLGNLFTISYLVMLLNMLNYHAHFVVAMYIY